MVVGCLCLTTSKAPAAKPVSSVMLCISLDFIGAPRGNPVVWAAQGLHTLLPRLAP